MLREDVFESYSATWPPYNEANGDACIQMTRIYVALKDPCRGSNAQPRFERLPGVV